MTAMTPTEAALVAAKLNDQYGAADVHGAIIKWRGAIPTPTEITAALTAARSDVLRVAIQAECKRRIYAVASQNTQMNMTAAAAAGVMSESDKSDYLAALAWVAAMRAKSAELIANADADYALDGKWPVCPPSVVALANTF